MASQALAANGAKVYIAGRRMEALKTAAEAHGKENVEGELIPIQMDETDIESVKKAYEEISKKEDRLNLLVNNAGLAGPRADISAAEKGPEAFKEAMLKLPKSAWDDVVSFITNFKAQKHNLTAELTQTHLLDSTTPTYMVTTTHQRPSFHSS